MPILRPIAGVSALVVLAACGGGDDEPESPAAVVRVESVAPNPAIASICIDEVCQAFDPADEARSAEFSAVIDELAPVEVLLVGDEEGFGTGGDVGPGGCLLVRYDGTGIVAEAGCPATTDG